MKQFPKDFLWGVATASYQIEGAAQEGGRSPSIWDDFARTPGKVFEGHTGDVACDHYHRYPEDVHLMKELGVQAYRFSISWSRLFPEKGVFNQAGLEFYKRLIRELKARGIQPAATIYHWDLPSWAQAEGGWANRDTVLHFVDYATTLFRELGRDVGVWITHNEPWCAAFLGYGEGVHAPGHQDWREALISSHHLLLSHGLAVQAYRDMGLTGEIGITLNFTPTDAASDAPADVIAASRWDGYANRWFLDPLFKGHYPVDMIEWFGEQFGPLACIQPGDLETIAVPIDFLGVNFYSRNISKAGADNALLGISFDEARGPVTDMGWEVHPESLYRLLKRLEQEYTGRLPLYITENGAAYPDQITGDAVHDPERVRYLHEHLEACQQFVAEGGNLKGYYVWSFLDNFEWAFGYSKRFGIVYVDYETQRRIPKDSALWFARTIADNGVQPTRATSDAPSS
ncbi:GH1 family beta-glucosidase [Tumebacillus permanentifrigoris]|uniref:Beta-glucosidase n=1 Tax=Tumebacillus permanentifrigoris TaxID=378543 RepID=A0A316DCJ5_9BACL|nr:GH1 family beta-glucosidase [Tumebacillus permanentifrigoris]PWK14913.1 broad-specificity cellobiase [Tumebacillus permanentifrigoris]